MTLLVVAWCDLLCGSVEIGGEEAGVSVDVGGGNLEEKLAPSSSRGEPDHYFRRLWQQTTQPGVWASTEKP